VSALSFDCQHHLRDAVALRFAGKVSGPTKRPPRARITILGQVPASPSAPAIQARRPYRGADQFAKTDRRQAGEQTDDDGERVGGQFLRADLAQPQAWLQAMKAIAAVSEA
jgi:hypothetical protein